MPITRFAPSPTGLLHLGHAYSAWRSWEASRGDGWLLRIEDLDRERSQKAYEDALIEDLAWLGLTPSQPPLRQSERMTEYEGALDILRQENLLFPCFCSRKDIQSELALMPSAPHGPDGALYPGTCLRLDRKQAEDWVAEGRPHSWRLNHERAGERVERTVWRDEMYGAFHMQTHLFGHAILARKDTGVSYHLAVVVDDAASGVELVTRGCDLLPATHLHVLLQLLLGLPVLVWSHHPLVVDGKGKRLAKRADSEAIRSLRESGMNPGALRKMAEERLQPCTFP